MAGTGRSNYPHSFSQIPGPSIERSKFNRSSTLKTTFDAGYLIPVFTDEALPGDTFNLRMHNFCRMATPIYPLLDNLYLESFFFAVPLRILQDNFVKMMGEQTDPADHINYTAPDISASAPGHVTGSLSDYLGIPPGVGSVTTNSYFHRAYNLIWNEWFRDENIQDSLVVDKDDGPDSILDYVSVQRRGKRKDYMTSCLPWPQKGTAVSLPLGTTAPVVSNGIPPTLNAGGSDETIQWNVATPALELDNSVTGGVDLEWTVTGMEADLSSATAATINQIREAFQLQKLLERDARGGTRYTELVRAHFGVVSPDARLQRPEYLGGGSQVINVTPVPNTTDAGTAPQGELAAYATSQGSNHSFVHSFTEHCVVIGLVSVRADITYQEGLHKKFTRGLDGKFDFYWPALAHIGEQAVTRGEIYADGTANDDIVFGYQERYAEYRYRGSEVTGKMRSSAVPSLDPWHLAQEFDPTPPTLDNAFIVENPPMARVEAVPAEPDFLFDAFFEFTAARPIPTFSVPGLIDHF